MKLKILTIAVLAMTCLAGKAQTIEIVYEYDDAGNRIQREYKVIQPPATAMMENKEVNENSGTKNNETETTQEPEVYQDLVAEKQIKIYPNPTRGKLKIDMINYNTHVEGSIQVFDMSGRMVTNVTALTETMQIDITGEPSGSYIMIIVVGSEKSEWKIVKQ